MESTRCPIWKTPATRTRSSRDGKLMDSVRAGGRYLVSGTAGGMVDDLEPFEKILLTSWLVEQRRQGCDCPTIYSTTLKAVTSNPQLSDHERADNLLRYLAEQSDALGKVIKFHALANTDAAETESHLLAWTASLQMSEVIWLAQYCHDKGWIDYRVNESAGSGHDAAHEMTLTPQGSERIVEIDGKTS